MDRDAFIALVTKVIEAANTGKTRRQAHIPIRHIDKLVRAQMNVRGGDRPDPQQVRSLLRIADALKIDHEQDRTAA